MRRTEVLQGLRRMKFEDIYGRWQARRLSQAEAAEILGMSERTFRRWRERYEGEGAAGLLDRRLGKVSARRVPVDRIDEVLSLYRERYGGFTAKHFHDKLRQHHGFTLGYTWTKLRLQGGRPGGARRRVVRRTARSGPGGPSPGMMLHQDGSSHRWLPTLGPGARPDRTMDDATTEIYSAFWSTRKGPQSSFQALGEVIADPGLPCALYTDRASHYFHTPKAGAKVARDQPTQVGRALAQLGIEHIPAYSPEARGRSERAFGTLQDRLPKELALAGITTVEAANRFLERGLSARAQRPLRGRARAARDGLRRRSRRCPSRHPLCSGGARGRQRQHRPLPGSEPPDPAEPDAPALRQGASPRPRLPRRHARDLPRTPLSRPLPGRRRPPRPYQPLAV